ncbi:MAG: MarR family transcriptional regulator [Sphingomonas sp.]|uniref:MarR family winged helix-turn-helix transcriptional regulator n=1 Tax=Sphingomonas sp. TaxID=28214 RepID=UPI0035A876B2|nr:MarR family transcriptional regulator [Sphingomonas sp.]
MSETKFLTPQQMGAACLCLNTQRAARAVARRYDAAFRPIGITSGQFSILAGLNQAAPVNIGTLADALGLERTTLTRNLAPLERAGLIQSTAADGDKRVRGLTLTSKGRDKLSVAMPFWSAIQADSVKQLAPHDWQAVQPALDRLGEG